MFYWANQIQRNRMEFDYLGALKEYVNAGDLEDSSFIDSLNFALGGSPETDSNRTEVFFNALRSFGLIEEKTVDVNANATNSTEAQDNATIIEADSEGNATIIEAEADSEGNATIIEDDANSTAANITVDSQDTNTNDTAIEMTALIVDSSLTATVTTNYCGASWTSAATNCGVTCPSGMDMECPNGMFCFAEITSCTSGSLATVTTNWCGKDWDDAASVCTKSCPAGLDSGK
jgi:hypothetical protein